MSAITSKRPVVATFVLQGREWDAFSKFYEQKPRGVLTKEELSSINQSSNKEAGHAVVLVGCNSNSLRFMNSWGYGFADNGFFRISLDRNMLKCMKMQFYDVYWTINDLKQSEIEAFENEGRKKALEEFERLTKLQTATHRCHRCGVVSPVMSFQGSLKEIKCPSSNGCVFSIDEAGADVKLVVFLALLNVE